MLLLEIEAPGTIPAVHLYFQEELEARGGGQERARQHEAAPACLSLVPAPMQQEYACMPPPFLACLCSRGMGQFYLEAATPGYEALR